MVNNDLYQEMIMDHYKNPRNCCDLHAHYNHQAEGDNPLCGDHIEVFLEVKEGIIKELCFKGAGCAISQASASMMTENIKGKPVEEVLAVYQKVHEMLTGQHPEEIKPTDSVKIGKLKVLEGVAEFPMRVKCASLAWHTLKAAIESKMEKITTEA